jgi:chemotaxis signal transduction protein
VDLLIVALGSERVGLPAEDVRSFARLGACAPLPGAPDVVLGVAMIDGRALPVVDLRAAIGAPLRAALPGDRVVVAKIGARRAALRVDAALGFASFDDDELPPLRVLADLRVLLSSVDERRLAAALHETGPSARTATPAGGTALGALVSALARLRAA